MRFGDRELVARPGDILGRGRHADVVIEATVVSRKHAQLHRGPAGWFLADLGSSNGLFGPDGTETAALELPAGTTRFTLGPPSSGCVIDVTVPDELAEVLTSRTPRTGPDTAPPVPPTQHQPHALSPQDHVPHPPPVAAVQVVATPETSPPGVSVRAEDLSVVVDGDLTILATTTLSLPAGSMTAIVGPSGCGKSTLANLLSGRGEPTTGTVKIDGQPMTTDIRKRIGVVPQYDAVHEQLTVARALRAAAKLRLASDTSTDVIDAAVVSAAEVLGLDERLTTPVSKLSGGQKKRVSVGYELVSDPVMMVLDEPTSGLDPGLEQELIEELRALADRGTTTVVVTHSTEAAAQADLVVVMAPGGHLAFIGPPGDVLAHFGVTDWADVFGRLTSETAAQWASYFATTTSHVEHVATPPTVQGENRSIGEHHERSWFTDFSVMTGRYLRTVLADWRSLALMAVQAPTLGLLFAFVLSTEVFASSLRPRTTAREFVLACVLAMVWIGASNSVREIVKERRTFLRERAVGVSPGALVASRWTILALVTVLQAIVLYFTATSRQEVPLSSGVLIGSGPIELISALALTGLASVGLGLTLSGTVRDANKAMAVLPILLIPVVLFSGLLIPLSGSPGIEQIGWINPIQWGSSAAAAVTDVLANEGCNPSGLEAQLQQALLGRTISCTNPRWQPTAATQAINMGVAVLHVAVLAVMSFVVTARSTRTLRM